MRFIQVLLITMLMFGPASGAVFAKGAGEGRTVAAAKTKKAKKAKKTKKAKASAKAVKKGKKAKRAAKAKKARKAKKAKAKKVASHRVSHAPAEMTSTETAADPAQNFEVSPEMQDDLPAPNNGDLTD